MSVQFENSCRCCPDCHHCGLNRNFTIVMCDNCEERIDNILDIGCTINDNGCYCVDCASDIAKEMILQREDVRVNTYQSNHFVEG